MSYEMDFFMVLLESQVTLKTGDVAPDFELLGIDDKNHSLNEYKEFKGLLVIFMCNHCPYVKAKIDAIKEIHEKFKDDIASVSYTHLTLPTICSV